MRPIIWLTGNSGAGKSTLAYGLAAEIDHSVVLDGDVMRWAISPKMGYQKEAKHEHNLRVARLASVLANQGCRVIVSVIAPYVETRTLIDATLLALKHPISVVWIYVKRKRDHDEKYPYEIPEDPELEIDHDLLNESEALIRLANHMHEVF